MTDPLPPSPEQMRAMAEACDSRAAESDAASQYQRECGLHDSAELFKGNAARSRAEAAALRYGAASADALQDLATEVDEARRSSLAKSTRRGSKFSDAANIYAAILTRITELRGRS